MVFIFNPSFETFLKWLEKEKSENETQKAIGNLEKLIAMYFLS